MRPERCRERLGVGRAGTGSGWLGNEGGTLTLDLQGALGDDQAGDAEEFSGLPLEEVSDRLGVEHSEFGLT